MNKDSWSVEVITGLEGEQAQGTPREIPAPPDEANVPSNPVPPDKDEVPSNPLPPDQQDAQQGVYDGSTEESSEDDEDILWQRSQEKLAKVKCYFLGGLSLHLNHLIQSRMEISYRLFGTLPIGLLLSNLDSRQLETSPMTSYDQC